MKVLFELYKNKAIKNSEFFKMEISSKYNIKDKELSELYIQIVNYQIKKFGTTLYYI